MPVRGKAAIYVAIAIALYGALDFYGAMSKSGADPYHIADLIERYSAIPGMTPANESLGYLSNEHSNSVKGQVLYLSALYGVAPRAMSAKADAQWVLGNFTGAGDWHSLAEQNGLEPMKDFRNGVVLLRKKGR